MFNIGLMLISTILCFGGVILVEKLFKKDGLMMWVPIASILANILVCKTVNILGFTSALGNVMFASNFLAMDIMTEKYGSKYSKKAIILSLVAIIMFIVTTQIALLFIPDATDISQSSMETLFTLSFRICVSSVTMYFISNLLNIYIFDKIKQKVPGKLWLRSGISTIISNCTENYLLYIGSFAGILDMPTILSIATTCSIIEIILCLLDIPFLYLSKTKIKKEELTDE